MHRIDPRWFQIGSLGSLLLFGTAVLGFGASPARIAAIIGMALLTQLACTALIRAPRFEWTVARAVRRGALPRRPGPAGDGRPDELPGAVLDEARRRVRVEMIDDLFLDDADLSALGFWIQYSLYRTNGLLWSLFACSPLVPLIDRFLPAARFDWRAPATSPVEKPTGAAGPYAEVPMLRAALSLFLVALLLFPATAEAFCGFYVAKGDAKLFNKASQVVLVRDDDRTVLTMASDYEGDPRAFALVVPVPRFAASVEGRRRLRRRARVPRGARAEAGARGEDARAADGVGGAEGGSGAYARSAREAVVAVLTQKPGTGAGTGGQK